MRLERPTLKKHKSRVRTQMLYYSVLLVAQNGAIQILKSDLKKKVY